jgi:hypothetical protein
MRAPSLHRLVSPVGSCRGARCRTHRKAAGLTGKGPTLQPGQEQNQCPARSVRLRRSGRHRLQGSDPLIDNKTYVEMCQYSRRGGPRPTRGRRSSAAPTPSTPSTPATGARSVPSDSPHPAAGPDMPLPPHAGTRRQAKAGDDGTHGGRPRATPSPSASRKESAKCPPCPPKIGQSLIPPCVTAFPVLSRNPRTTFLGIEVPGKPRIQRTS